MNYKKYSSKIEIIKGDITKIQVEAIVNAANSRLAGGGGVDGAIHRAAGGEELHRECIKIIEEKGNCPPGKVAITSAGKLKAKYIIHTVGPIWRGGNNNEEETLSQCYWNTLKLAIENKIKTIAFPNISTGIYGFPKLPAAKIALNTVSKFVEENKDIEKVIFVCFDEENWGIYRGMLNSARK
ncbi:macro domain-containing protein LIC [Clostridium pasteurianum DSM 525 = ATCC 6013]|uniref:Appr-1-p processing domain protein n=1 Tax=Clostridium pasteurianum DSM 525 = ATCC 6013 TaxID=1262449 RepID=A0A0H3J5J0_CLOPA|nr:O-acetyl-ADP-ribose deacetylase [Clostridium pasteurianum]AJA48719.1 macro domain-containing protein LIC [Clostridium pasteurianum DSM 525 = ATCC 6013]AJA52707.1 macro domain-containing protein LIC [Clostridium pasteurianum DSM 525 = ATCC 6013]AOZ75943.1 macro domain-containing protein [Clostridium pasteurianum DSM 525 = ATCC 6013]AOZ79739.1 macro domain-containing protein [Clostridium pasteurianum]ELP60018.1 Appr-1-p processing protein [Clostridium pasteurianum DSM 525 = ATCC 6013]